MLQSLAHCEVRGTIRVGKTGRLTVYRYDPELAAEQAVKKRKVQKKGVVKVTGMGKARN